MAAVRRSLPEADLCCSICCDIFRDPVVLRCSHSFCSSCLRDYWAVRDRDRDTGRGRGRGRGGDRGRDCPLCRRRFDEDDDAPPVHSLTLRNLCEAYVSGGGDGEQKKSPSSAAADGEEEEEREELYNDPGEMCALHGERLKLFCLEDREPICVVCHTSRQHKSHDCCPAAEAVADLKVHNKSI
ncbi:hypothetical protein CRUP_024439 [Coryphaenoides rupestris]|nr:hypothetical protein CRUP_024439 [Coryphaenoides rupestris]